MRRIFPNPRTIGETLADLKSWLPKGIKDAFAKLPLLKDLWSMAPHVVVKRRCVKENRELEGADVDLSVLPIQHCLAGKTLRCW